MTSNTFTIEQISPYQLRKFSQRFAYAEYREHEDYDSYHDAVRQIVDNVNSRPTHLPVSDEACAELAREIAEWVWERFSRPE